MSDPVVLLHAGVCDRRMWDDVLPVLREDGRTVVAPDLRGFGTRPLGVASFSHARDTIALLDGLGADRAHLVGASFGGGVALQVASLAPERVASLALFAPGLRGWDYTDADLVVYGEQEEAALARGDVDEVVRLGVEMWAGSLSAADRAYVADAQRRAIVLGGEGADEEEVPFDLSRVAAETLVVVGDGDASDFVAIGRHLEATLPRVELRVWEGAGHLLALERPDMTAEVIAGWLRDR